MGQERWKVVEEILKQVERTTPGVVMAIAPDPLDVVLYEAPVLARSQPPLNPLRGFIQEAVSLLDRPVAAEIAAFLYLPGAVVELVLGNLQQLGGAASDTAGRWSVPAGAPEFRNGRSDPPTWRRTRKLLCYWPKLRVLLPVLPRMRLRDLVKLNVHNVQGEVAEWYGEIASWSDAEGLRRGRSQALRVLPLRADSVPAPSESSRTTTVPHEPLSMEEILVSQCKLDVIALMSSSLDSSGVWEMTSRLWSRPTPIEDTGNSGNEPFAPGELVLGLSLPEQLLGGGSKLDDLGNLFDPSPDAWRTLLDDRDGLSRLRRDLEGKSPALIVEDQGDSGEERPWRLLLTRLAPEARLLCFRIPAPTEAVETKSALGVINLESGDSEVAPN